MHKTLWFFVGAVAVAFFLRSTLSTIPGFSTIYNLTSGGLNSPS